MFKKSVLCLLTLFLIFGTTTIAEGTTVEGVGVRGVITVIEPVAPLVRDRVGVTIRMKEEKAGPTVTAIGEKKADFGMMTRYLTDAEKKKWPDVKAIPFAKDGVAIIVHEGNPVKGLTSAQIADIYAGKITDWSQVGGRKGRIKLNIREKGSGQRVAMEGAIMGGVAVAEREAFVIDRMGAMRDDVSLERNAIGYILISAVRKGVKAIKIDGKAPTVASLKAGVWPIEVPMLLLTPGEPVGPTKAFIDLLLSPDGQEAVMRGGVAPIAPVR